MPLPIAGIIAGASAVFPNLFKGKTSESTAIQRVKESLDGAFRARDARTLLIVSQKGKVALPYPNSNGPGWSTVIDWSVSKPDFHNERDAEAAYAGALYQQLTGSQNPPPSGAQIPNVSAIGAHSDSAGDSSLSAVQRAIQAAITAGRTDLLNSAGLTENTNVPADRAPQQAGLSPIIIVLVLAGLFFLMRRK